MADFKVVISDPKSKNSYQKELEQHQSQCLGKKINDKIKGDAFGLTGYELQITGGSDKDGFPMRSDMEGIGRKKILVTAGVGFHSKKKGERKRKSIRGNTISTAISQINTKVVTYGSKPIEKLIGKTEKREAVKEEAKPEEPKEEKPVEKAPEEEVKTEESETPKTEESKEETKTEEPKAPETKSKEEAKPEDKPKE